MSCIDSAGEGRTSAVIGRDERVGLDLLWVMHYGATERQRQQAREDAICFYLDFVTALARRFRCHGVPDDDLYQIAALALVKSIDRFDFERGASFRSFVAPTVLGELKRYFRDHTWAMRTPRRLQELVLALGEANDRLTVKLERSPSVTDLAAELSVSPSEVLEALECGWSYRAMSLDLPTAGGTSAADVQGPVTQADPGFERAENWQVLQPALRKLSEQDRQVLRMRFIDEMSQSQIARRLGVSQMQVSRLLSRCLAKIRVSIIDDCP